MYMSLHFLSCSGFGLIMMFKIYGTDGLSGCYGKWVDMQSMGGERNAHKRSFLWLVQYRTRDKCPSFCCKDFFVTFFELQDQCLSLSSIRHFTLLHVWATKCDMPGSADAWITIRARRCWVCCVPKCVEVHLAVWLQGKTLQTETSQNWYYKQTMMHIHHKMKTFLLRVTVTVTLTMTQMMLVTQTSQIDWQYKLWSYCTCTTQSLNYFTNHCTYINL